MKLVVLPGDGIGPEVMAAAECVLKAADARYGLGLEWIHDIAGHESLRRHGATVTDALLDKVLGADGLMLGPMATFDFKDEARGEINPSKYFRKALDLHANIRPSRTYPGVPCKVGQFDLVVVRENTEGFYADRNIESGSSEMLITPDVAISLRRITRPCCERIARSAFELATTRRRHLTIVHKANVLKIADGMFLQVCREVGREFPEVEIEEILVDAMMAHVVRAPARFDVIVTTNMFGDILSDLTAELSGSLGLGGSLNAGKLHAMGQAAHGSAPDIAGLNLANPASLVISAAMLLRWHGQRQGLPAYVEAGAGVESALARAIADGRATRDLGGTLGTDEMGREIALRVGEA